VDAEHDSSLRPASATSFHCFGGKGILRRALWP
jgi:hypothetical protein